MGRLTHRTLPGWTYFITTKAWQSVSVFQAQATADIVTGKLIEYRDKGNYLLHEFVLMPNHLHLILTPTGSVTLEKVMQLIKGGSSHEIHRVRENKMQIWQSGFHESRVVDWSDYRRKADYIRFNPVTAKLVERPEDWAYSSASAKCRLDPIPQGLKPLIVETVNVGAKAPTPSTQLKLDGAPELKLRPPKEESGTAVVGSSNVGAKAPTPNQP